MLYEVMHHHFIHHEITSHRRGLRDLVDIPRHQLQPGLTITGTATIGQSHPSGKIEARVFRVELRHIIGGPGKSRSQIGEFVITSYSIHYTKLYEESYETAEVLAASDGVVLKIGDRIETGVPGRLVYPDVPADLRDRPTLVMQLHSAKGGEQQLELAYLTTGLA